MARQTSDDASCMRRWQSASNSARIKSTMLVTEHVPDNPNSQSSSDSCQVSDTIDRVLDPDTCDRRNEFPITQRQKPHQTRKASLQQHHCDQQLMAEQQVINHSFRNNSNLNKCPHHRTKTKPLSNHPCPSKDIVDDLPASLSLLNCHSKCSTNSRPISSESGYSLTTPLIKWTLIKVALIYMILTSVSFKMAQATQTATNYWPLVHQHPYQQLFFTGSMQTQSNKHADDAMFVPTSAPVAERRRLNPLRHNPQQTAAIAAAAAAMAATADAALARKSQSHNLMIGQKFNNYSSIIPYSLMQDVDYSQVQEDQIINEPMSDTHTGRNNMDDHHQVSVSDELKLSDSISELSAVPLPASRATPQVKVAASDRALLPLDSNRLMLPQMQQIKARFNQGCVGGTKCQFFAFCWMSGGSLGASCGLLMTCCVTPSRQEIQPGFYGPVVNDPCKYSSDTCSSLLAESLHDTCFRLSREPHETFVARPFYGQNKSPLIVSPLNKLELVS